MFVEVDIDAAQCGGGLWKVGDEDGVFIHRPSRLHSIIGAVIRLILDC